MRFKHNFWGRILGIVLAIGLCMKVNASQMDMVPLSVSANDVISVIVPTMDENHGSVFDFILDPQGLINETNAARYGGRTFEEGATLYFENTNGLCDFSARSDRLSIVNQGTAPVKVTIRAYMDNLGDIVMTEDNSFTEDDNPSIYMALVDSEGRVVPFDSNGEATIATEILFDSYEYGLTGACNPNGDWTNVIVQPRVTVVWMVEPIVADQEELTATVSGNDALTRDKEEGSVSGSDI